MNSSINFKVWQYYCHKNKNKGFTWMDLLVTIFIFSIIAAIVQPCLMSQPHKNFSHPAAEPIHNKSK